MGTLLVSEVFGPTFQGEGPSLGTRAGFIRLGRCDLNCRWCDTPYTWDWKRFDPAVELRRIPVADLLVQVADMAVPLVVITGGEPMLQQRHLVPLLAGLVDRGMRIEIETNGRHAPMADVAGLVARFNVSPKLRHSGVDPDVAIRPDALARLAALGSKRVAFKFVVAGPGDLAEVADVVVRCRLDPATVWIMPEGTTAEQILDLGHSLAAPVLERGWHLTTRLQVLLWGDRRGV